MKENTKQALWYTADVILLLAGSIIAVIASAAKITPSQSYLDAIDVLLIIVLCFLAVFVLVEIVSVYKISDSTFHTVLTAAALFCYELFSDDFVNLLRTATTRDVTGLFDCIHFAFFVCTTLSLVYFWNYTFHLTLKRKHALCIIGCAALCIAGYVGLYFVGLQILAYFLYLVMLIAVEVVEIKNLYSSGKPGFSFHITNAMMSSVLGLSLVDELCSAQLVRFSAMGFASFYGISYIIIFSLVYVAFAMRTDRAALQASEYKLKYETIKSDALRDQIKPHFIFNSLAAIQSIYHESIEAGDRATNLFSRHLRANVEASNVDLISFEKELDNIQVYVDLENMRRKSKFNIIFDIDFADFQIPVLSLQPYIENAIRYSKVNEKEDGYIKISSIKTENDILLEISDNGVGFDLKSIPSTSCGIRNSRERFSMLMGIEPQIVSKIGEGTTVTLHIPLKEQL